MTKDELLKKEAEEKYDTKYGKRCENLWNGAIFSLGYLAGAEPREKRIEELEQDLSNKKLAIQNRKADIERLEQENAELRYQLNKNPCVYNTEWHCNDCLELLTKAKEIMKHQKELLDSVLQGVDKTEMSDFAKRTFKEAEQFLNGNGCPDILCEDCTKEVCGVKKLWVGGKVK